MKKSQLKRLIREELSNEQQEFGIKRDIRNIFDEALNEVEKEVDQLREKYAIANLDVLEQLLGESLGDYVASIIDGLVEKS